MSRGEFEARIKSYIAEHGMLEKGDRVTVGVSGGADSVCLIFVLNKLSAELDLKLTVLHVMHGIRGDEAVRDMEFVRDLCRRFSLEFVCVKKDVPRIASLNRMTIEEAGRAVRYEAFESTDCDRIAVAHNADDMAETVLFNLFRGCNIKGLCGIAPVSGKVIRPLLSVSRREIEAYLKENGLTFMTDSTNLDNDYARNKIRNIILPKAAEINFRASSHIDDTAKELLKIDEFLERQTAKAYEKYTRKDGSAVVISALAADETDEVILQRVIYRAIFEVSGRRKDVSRVHIEDTAGLFSMQSGRSLSLIYGLCAVRSFDSIIIKKDDNTEFFGDEYEEIPLSKVIEERRFTLPGGCTAEAFIIDSSKTKYQNLQYTKWFDYDKICNGAVFRTRDKGDVIAVKNGSKKVKDVLIEEKIPQWKRSRLYMLADGSDIMWIPGIRYSEKYKVDESTKRVLVVTWEEA